MIESIVHRGEYLRGCSLKDETRADGIYPGHFNGVQVAADRFLLVYATRGFRGVDEDRSIVYQLRRDAYDGPVIREGFIVRAADDWDVLGDGRKHPRLYGSPIVFGVPRGALVSDTPASNANVFVILFRCNPRQLRSDGTLETVPASDPRFFANLHTQWMQVRLNVAGDDLEIVAAPQPLAPRGQESFQDVFGDKAQTFNVPLTNPQPIDADCTRWVYCANVGPLKEEKLAVIELAWNSHDSRYEWVDTGLPFGQKLTEAAMMKWNDQWLIAARTFGRPHVAWFRAADPMGPMPEPVYPPQPRIVGPHTAYVCADGMVRLLGSPLDIDEGNRNPLCIWDIDPDRNWDASEPRIVCDVREQGIVTDLPHGEMAKLLPHTGGDTQAIVHRIRTRYTRDATRLGRVIRPEEMNACGQYYATVRYASGHAPRWQFDKGFSVI